MHSLQPKCQFLAKNLSIPGGGTIYIYIYILLIYIYIYIYINGIMYIYIYTPIVEHPHFQFSLIEEPFSERQTKPQIGTIRLHKSGTAIMVGALDLLGSKLSWLLQRPLCKN